MQIIVSHWSIFSHQLIIQREGREKGRATEIGMDERMQRKKGQGNCGAKRERLSDESGRYRDKKGEKEEGKGRI